MAEKNRSRRRQAGEGTISEYTTKSGPRFLIKYQLPQEDGRAKVVLRRRDRQGRPFLTRKAAAEELGDVMAEIRRGVHVVPSKATVGQWLDLWLQSLRKQPSTVVSYRKNVRLHVTPHIGGVRLDHLTGARLTKLYRQLEATGRADGTGGLSARTVRYVHTIVHAGLAAAVRDGLLSANPADRADPPSAKSATSPEMRHWSAAELRAFLENAKAEGDVRATAWALLAATGMRRGEALALRWSDVDFEGARLSVRRAAVLVKEKGAGERLIVGPTKAGRPRTVDLDPDTVAMLRAHRAAQGTLSLALARDDSPVLSDLTGQIQHPERFSRHFDRAVARAREQLGDDVLSRIRLHDLRHTHASLLLAAGIPVKVVSERLGHANATITLGVYAHVMSGMQAEAAARFAALMSGSA